LKGWINMKLTKRIAAAFLALSMTAGAMGVYAASATTPGYKLINTYNEDAGTITADIYVTDGYGAVGQIGLFYDTELLDLGAKVDGEYTADFDAASVKITDIITAASGGKYTVTATAETNKIPDLVNEDEGQVFFAWYSGATANVDAREEDKKILSLTFFAADGVEASDLEEAGTDLLTFATDKPSNTNVKGYSSGVYCANEENTAFRNSASAKNKITLSVEFVGLDIEEEKETVTIKVTDADGEAIEGAFVKIGSEEVETDKNGEAEFEVSGTSYSVYYKLTEDDDYVALKEGTTAVISAPEKVGTPSVSTGTEKLTVSWTKPATNGSNITKYIVSYTKTGGKEATKEVEGDTTKLVLTGLTGGSKYTIKVKAVNAIGEGEYSAEKTATPTKASGTDTGSSTGSGTGSGTTTPSVSKYTVTYDVGVNGTMTAGSKTESVEKGKYPVNVPTVKAKEGYKFLGWAKAGGSVIDPTKIQITAATTFIAQYEKIEEKPAVSFTDVDDGTYYADPVQWAVNKGITTGTSATTFSPDATCTRAQAVTFLWRAAGSPAPKNSTMAFTDVQSGSYYYNAVLWAVENGITNGTSETTFSPDNFCTRAQIVTFLWRSQKTPAVDAANPFADVDASQYYTNAVLWAVGNGITNGTSETTFSPDANCTRAQIVTFLYRCLSDEK